MQSVRCQTPHSVCTAEAEYLCEVNVVSVSKDPKRASKWRRKKLVTCALHREGASRRLPWSYPPQPQTEEDQPDGR